MNIIKPGTSRVLVIGGPANGQSPHVDPSSDMLKIQSPVAPNGLTFANPQEWTYRIRKLRIVDPVTGKECVYRLAMHDSVPLETAFNVIFLMYHLGQVGGSTLMPERIIKQLWRD